LPAPQPGKLCRPPYYGGTTVDDLSDPITPESGGDGTGTPTTGTPTTGTPNSGDASSSDSHESSACQFGPASTPGGALGLLSVLGALFGLARRRRLT
jgi:MYXO-CTERM domain-containing protein